MAYQIKTQVKSGNEMFIGLPSTLVDYWQWAHSDVCGNAERGKLAEYLVKCAVGAHSPCRVEWDAVDVISPEGIRIEVKSSSYLQTWKCSGYSKIIFDIAPKKSWNSETNIYYEDVARNSDVYIFCLFACKDPEIANPLDTTQWEFYILPTSELDRHIPKQKTIGLSSLLKLGAIKADFSEIHTKLFNIMKTKD